MGQYPKTSRLKWWSLLALEFCLINQVTGQTLPHSASGKSDRIAQRLSIPVSVSPAPRVPDCAPWTFKNILATFSSTKGLHAPLELSNASKPAQQTYESITDVAPLARFQSLADVNWPVPDPAIAAGVNHILVAVNSRLAVYDKNGDKLRETSLAAWFQDIPLQYDCGPFNPRLLYDHFENRWIFAALANAKTTSYILFAVSEGSNPLGDWYAWALNASQDGSNNTPLMANDLTLGLGANTVFLSTNQYAVPDFQYAKVRLLDTKEIKMRGRLNWWDLWEFKDRDKESSFAVIPAVSFNREDTSVFFVNTKRVAGKILSLWRVIPNDSSAPTVDAGTVELDRGYSQPVPALQSTSGNLLFAGDARVLSAITQGSILWLCFATGGVDFDMVGDHVRVLGLDSGEIVFPKIDPFNGQWNFMPSLAVDKTGHLGLPHYSSDSTHAPSLRIFLNSPDPNSDFPERRAVFWQSPQPFQSQSNPAFWGQRTSVALDPVDQVTFWGIGEIVNSERNDQWTTYGGAASWFKPDLKFESPCDTLKIVRGEPKSLHLEIRNSGEAFAGRTRLAVFFSLDKTRSNDDVIIDTTTVDFINAGTNRAIDFNLTIEKSPKEDRGFLLFGANYRNLPEESDSTNNVLTCPVDIQVRPLECSLSFLYPSRDTLLCADSICVKLLPKIVGGVPPYKIVKISVNGIPGDYADTRISACLKLNSGENILSAQATVVDALDSSTSCNASIKVVADLTAPKIEWKYAPAYPHIRGTISDPESGIQSIATLILRNATLHYDPFSPGAKKVDFRLAPADASKPVTFFIAAANVAGCDTTADPLIFRLEAESPRSAITMEVPAQDHFFNIENHGLSQITLEAGDVRYYFIADAEKRGRVENTFYMPLTGGWTVDITELWSTENFDVALTAFGNAGQYAYVIFSDQPWDFTNPLEESPDGRLIPQSFALWPSYPNPFNPSTTIRVDIAAGNQRPVSLKIFNLHGQLVATLLDGFVAPGEYELVWYGRDNQNNPAGSGVYFYVLQAHGFRSSRKMTLVR